MKKVVMLVVLLGLLVMFGETCFAGSVNGYYRSNGTYVQPYYRSDSNGTVRDNYGYKGNYNPYTGKTETNYYRHNSTSEYYDGNSDSDD